MAMVKLFACSYCRMISKSKKIIMDHVLVAHEDLHYREFYLDDDGEKK
jgi:hypothetical protein